MSKFFKTADTIKAGATTLPQKFYTDEMIFNNEIKNLFYKNWLCVGRVQELTNNGDYLTVSIGKENIIILLSNDSEIKAFYNVCRHRGTRLCTETDGRFPKTIQCPYHGWTYDLSGKLVGAPLMDTIKGFDKKDYPLHSVDIVQWEGFLFINLSDSPESFKEIFKPLLSRFSSWNIESLIEYARHDYEVNCNWKLIIQNYSECYHCPIIHPDLADITPYTEGRNDLFEGPFLGGFMNIFSGKESVTQSGHICAPFVGNLSEEDQKRVYYYSIFPNMLLSLHPDYIMYHTVLPKGNDRSLITCRWLFSPKLANGNDYHPEDAINLWHKTNLQDWNICEQSQQGIESKKYSPAPYSGQESLLAAFDKYYLSKLNI